MAKFPMLCVVGVALLMAGCVSEGKAQNRRVELTVASPGK